MHFFKTLLAITLVTIMLGGCAAVVVTGAATGANAVHDRRTVGAFIDDEGIELKVRLAVTEDKQLFSEVHVNIISVNGVVLLVGQAPTEELRMKIVDITKAVEKVRVVHDEMTIAAPNSYMVRSSDSLITAKVKGSLFGIKGQEGFDPTRVKVVTENGIVYLMGILYRPEGDAVALKASHVSGVQKVVKLFEYID